MDYNPQCSSVYGITQARLLERVAISFPKGASLPKDRTYIIALAGKFFTTELLVKPFGPPKDQYLTIPPKEDYCLISNNIDNICLCLELYMDRVIQFVLLCVWILSFKRDSPQRQTNILWYHLYVQSKTYNKLMNKTNKKQTHYKLKKKKRSRLTENKLVVSSGERKGRRAMLEWGILKRLLRDYMKCVWNFWKL